ncbi:MAG: phosphatase PAP2 family protein [Candidatus Vogelbacteria bacterium]|nr:phosphatase PAP2 family protein [Candidatus Vogelbacteria bacterium]
MNELIFRYLYGLTGQSAFFGRVVVFSAAYFGWLLLALVIIVFARRSRDHPSAGRELFFIISAAAGAWLTAQVIKLVWPVARPFVKLADITPLITVSDQGSFPSGHATFFFALGIAAYSVDRRLGRWLIAAAAAVSLARVMSGVHWPSDILGGLVLALVAPYLILFFARLFNPGFGRRDS